MFDENGTILENIARGIIKESYGEFLKVGLVTRHPDGRIVRIESGEYFDSIYGRLSNFWKWREVLEDGTLSPILESGYGWQNPVIIEHEIKVIIKNAS